MLIAMLTVFLLGGGVMGGLMLSPTEIERIEDRVEVTLDDPERVASTKRILEELADEIESYDRLFIDSAESVGDIYRDHGAGRRQMLQTLEKLNLEWYASQSRGLKLRDRLKTSMNAAEWEKLFGDPG